MGSRRISRTHPTTSSPDLLYLSLSPSCGSFLVLFLFLCRRRRALASYVSVAGDGFHDVINSGAVGVAALYFPPYSDSSFVCLSPPACFLPLPVVALCNSVFSQSVG